MSGSKMSMEPQARHACCVALAVASVVGLLACAKSPTSIVTKVSVDGQVPPILLLRVTVASQADPEVRIQSSFGSLIRGDAADRPAPYSFPVFLSVDTPTELVGDVTVTVDGLDWDSSSVIATGSAAGQVVSGHRTVAFVTLAPAAGLGGGDGGIGDGGVTAGDSDDGGMPDAESMPVIACPPPATSTCPDPAPSFAGQIFPIVQQRCNSCHNPAVDPTLWPLATYADVMAWAGVISSDLTVCSMPPPDSGMPLPETERQLIFTWLACNAPDN